MSSAGIAAKTAQTALADKAAMSSIGLAGATWVLDMAPYFQLAATGVAIVAGITAAWYHYERAMYYRRRGRGESEE